MMIQEASPVHQSRADDRDHKRSPGPAADFDLFMAMRTDANVLLTGPKDRALALARRVHDESGWRYGPFTVIDCAGPHALERWLAGTDQVEDPAPPLPHARLMQAGSVLLQEVGEAPRTLQVRLADKLENLRQTPAGRRRVLASTSELLLPRVLEGSFDARLFYRLNVIHLSVPALLP